MHVDVLDPISLDEIRADASLQARVERKYIVDARRLGTLFERLRDTHRVLEIGARRRFGYHTTYYDTADLLSLREHLQGRRQRFKCRRRRYIDTGTTVLEVKLKAPGGRVVKHATPSHAGDRLLRSDASFVRACIRNAYGREIDVDALAPVLATECVRITLAAPDRDERLTCDVVVDLGGARLSAGYAIVESKSLRGTATADRLLPALGARPLPRCSKYCLGLALTRREVRAHEFRPLFRYFEPFAITA